MPSWRSRAWHIFLPSFSKWTPGIATEKPFASEFPVREMFLLGRDLQTVELKWPVIDSVHP
uniref:Uncharacterized protein n=1 Tax=Leptospirillum ferriphilum TaxID=178606 RepID=A0A7C3QU89_9BACT